MSCSTPTQTQLTLLPQVSNILATDVCVAHMYSTSLLQLLPPLSPLTLPPTPNWDGWMDQGVAPERLRRSPSLSALDDAVMGRCGPEAPGGAGGSVVFMLKVCMCVCVCVCVCVCQRRMLLQHKDGQLQLCQACRG
jgi:hypothetical protein